MKRKPFSQEYPLSSFKTEFSSSDAVDSLSEHIGNRLHSFDNVSEIVVLCIGTDRSTGDSLGPLVGSIFEKMYPVGVHIYGTIDEPVHAVNLKDTIETIERNHKDALIIAVDACLGKFSSVGHITVAHGPLKPGAGVKKDLPAVGCFHITGIVNIGGFMEYFVLQNTRLSIVMKMADTIAHSLHRSTSRYYQHMIKKASNDAQSWI
ncbi:spore protease YyaC [Ammoniphilus oxalaticus]|uniref:Spore protease YyaC n=1 Tax=Ammoniphilus oxalaticus TaxID=66863 RepID=A0A419SGH0_9BACL|nr:spore protease YyaC [Ammoniphilus oxalaticus]RKD22884.1 spore protease YyaC [Ammoniphilus oxalaticus]